MSANCTSRPSRSIAGHLGLVHGDVRLVVEQVAQRVPDRGRLEQVGGDLVQERLERVVVVPVDDRDVDVDARRACGRRRCPRSPPPSTSTCGRRPSRGRSRPACLAGGGDTHRLLRSLRARTDRTAGACGSASPRWDEIASAAVRRCRRMTGRRQRRSAVAGGRDVDDADARASPARRDAGVRPPRRPPSSPSSACSACRSATAATSCWRSRAGSTATGAGDVTGLPLLAPWANRLGARRYEVDGVAVDLEGLDLHTDDHGLPIHGTMSAQPGLGGRRQPAPSARSPPGSTSAPTPTCWRRSRSPTSCASTSTVDGGDAAGGDDAHADRRPGGAGGVRLPPVPPPARRRRAATSASACRPGGTSCSTSAAAPDRRGRTPRHAEDEPVGARTFDDLYELGDDRAPRV